MFDTRSHFNRVSFHEVGTLFRLRTASRIPLGRKMCHKIVLAAYIVPLHQRTKILCKTTYAPLYQTNVIFHIMKPYWILARSGCLFLQYAQRFCKVTSMPDESERISEVEKIVQIWKCTLFSNLVWKMTLTFSYKESNQNWNVSKSKLEKCYKKFQFFRTLM